MIDTYVQSSVMINTTVFNHLPDKFQFLHVCHYINSIGLLIFNDSTSNKQYQTITVLNAFFDYLNQSENETKAKQILLQKVLKGTDLYGGDEDETLDKEYTDKTYQYIINKALFSPYGGVTGYLASIVNKASNLNYNYFKTTVKYHFFTAYKSNDPCSSNNSNTNLSLTARTKILEDYIWSIFPQPEQDLNITDANYIYAMAGSKIVEALPIKNQLNFTFDEYIQLSRSAEIIALQNKAYNILEFFSTPALFFFAYKEKVKFREQNLTSLNAEFWNNAYQMLFSYLNETVEMLVQDAFKKSLHYKIHTEISKIKTRTAFAEMILKVACPNVSDSLSLKYLIERYKSQSVSGSLVFFIAIADLMDDDHFNCSNVYLPNLNQLFYTQFDNVRNTYYEIEKNSIQQALAAGGLLSKINLPNTSVERAKLPDIVSFCNTCGPNQRSIEKDIYLFFAINQDSKTKFYALQQKESTLTLIKNDGNEENFAQALGVHSSIKPQTEPLPIFLKKQHENSTVFVEGLAKIKTDQYISQLQESYYERTLVETVMNHLISFVPFYTCVSEINSGKAADAVLSCSIDIMSLLPVAGVASKYLNLIRSSFTLQMGKAFTAIRAVSRGGVTAQAAIRTGISEIFQAARTVTSQLLTQPIIRDLSIAFLRTIDPGVEMIYSLSRYGIRFLWRLFDNILLHIKSLTSSGRFLEQLKLMMISLKRVRSKIIDHTGMEPRIIGTEPGLEVVRYTYPDGIHSFGPKCLKVFGNTAEMRTSFEDMRQIPVVLSKIYGGIVYYKKIDLETGKLFDYELMLDNNDLLRRIKNSVKLMGMEALGNQVRNYDVYYNTVDKNQPLKRKIVLERREDASSFAARVGDRRGASESARVDKSDTSLPENQRIDLNENPSRDLDENPRVDLDDNQRLDLGENDNNYHAGPSRKKKVFLERRTDDKIKSDIIVKSNVPSEMGIATNLKFVEKPDSSLQKNQKVDLEDDITYEAGPSQKKKVSIERRIDDKFKSGRTFESNVPAEKAIATNLNFVDNPDTSLQKNQKVDLEENDISHQAGPSQKNNAFLERRIDDKIKSDNTLGSNVPLVKNVQTNLKYDEESGFHIDSFIAERNKGIDKHYLEVQDDSGLKIEQVMVAKEQERNTVVADGSNIQVHEPHFDIDEFLAERAKQVDYNTQQTNDDSKSTSNAMKLSARNDNLKMLNELRSWRSRTKEPQSQETNVVSNLKPMTDPNNVAILKNKFQQLIEYHYYYNDIERAADIYTNLREINQILSFEDYLLLWLQVMGSLPVDFEVNRIAIVATYRLALKQSSQNWSNNPIKLYRFKVTTMDVVRVYEKLKNNDVVTISNFMLCYDNLKMYEITWKTEKHERPILFEMTLSNQYGVADLERIMPVKGTHAIPSGMKFRVDNIVRLNFQDMSILKVQMSDSQLTREMKLSNLQHKLQSLN